MSRSIKDLFVKGIIYLATGITLSVLLFIIGFIFVQGIGLVNWDFLTRDFNEKVGYAFTEAKDVPLSIDEEKLNDINSLDNRYETALEGPIYVENIGAAISKVAYKNHSTEREQIVVTYLEKDSPLQSAIDSTGAEIKIGPDYMLQSINGKDFTDLSLEEVAKTIATESGELKIKIVQPGGGIKSNIITTLYMVLLSLLVALPVGIFGAIYLTEYAKPGKLVNIIRFAAESLAGIPSIIFGLFGMAFFVVALNFQISLISGSLTVAVILLPVIIRSTEEALKKVPMAFREGSLALGATKLQTIFKVVLPCAVPGIATAVLLSIGRVVGESAALLLTAGTVAQIPGTLFSPGSTLTVQAYYVAKEEGNIELACAVGIVIIVIVIVLNILSRITSDKLDVFNKK
ncbi:phosphate ABC transporter permease PstA [Acetobacterium sp. KB-1]|jgi:phosphate transport system permease protein|uniref:phosphate ABC transporter permease PstA n=1 Tax=Acetobacterium sp. KB-1 TaxID=2184575 RepID=UPI000DBEB0E8|nr:phosphate ABC transporter permease PtsA [Acetobacterium sp. KB-1]